MIIRPHPGPQEQALSTKADVAVMGGAAGGGKTRFLLMEPLRHIHVPGFGAVIFRRTHPEITNEGGLWDESVRLYGQIAAPKASILSWQFPVGPSITFGHMQYELDVLKWHSSQIAMIGFDELTTFSEYQFWYMFSRNRSVCGVRPYIRATCNPDADSWVAELIAWWIDQESGYPLPERSGVLRWFVRLGDELIWADSRNELYDRFPETDRLGQRLLEPKSFTFIPATLEDNPTLTQADPGYRANLLALPLVERERLLGGNWKIRKQAGMFFRVDKITPVEYQPTFCRVCRAWDLAATHMAGDWTVGAKLTVTHDGILVISDVVRGQWHASDRDEIILQTAKADGLQCPIRLPQDPGAAGKSEGQRLVRMLGGYAVTCKPVTGSKQNRAAGFASQVNGGNVRIVGGSWNRGLLDRMDAFPMPRIPDDEVDALSDAFNEILHGQWWQAFVDQEPETEVVYV